MLFGAVETSGSTSENRSAEPEIQIKGGPDREEAKSSNLLLARVLPFLRLGVFDGFFDILIDNVVNVNKKTIEDLNNHFLNLKCQLKIRRLLQKI